MSEPNPYTVLGLPDFSSVEVCKKRYRELALQLHPDRNNDPSATQRFQQVTRAWATIKDPLKRLPIDTQLVARRDRLAVLRNVSAIMAEYEIHERNVTYMRRARKFSLSRTIEQHPFVYLGGVVLFAFSMSSVVMGLAKLLTAFFAWL